MTLLESGVYNKLLHASYKPPKAEVFEPRHLTIHGNIFVQFVYHFVGLLIAFLIFVAELHKHTIDWFHKVRVKVDFLIRNFFYQSKQAILHGLNYGVIVRNVLKLLWSIWRFCKTG